MNTIILKNILEGIIRGIKYTQKMHKAFKTLFLVYFITHVPITLCVDLQAIFGDYYPQGLRQVMEWYTFTYNDILMAKPPIWLKSFIWCEFALQMPFFFVATYGLLYERNWIRIPSIVYGTHVATTVVPILSESITSKFIPDNSKIALVCFYYPYLLIPAMLAVYMCLNAEPFGKPNNRKL